MSRSIYGIDFGSSKVCLAAIDRNGNPVVIRNVQDASDVLGSEVYFESEDNVIIGQYAKDMLEIEDDRVIRFVKGDLANQCVTTYECDGRFYTPVEICAMILKQLQVMAGEQGEMVKDVVVAVPGYFGLQEKEALRNAVELAGLNLRGMVAEQTATMLAYLHDRRVQNQNILIYDLGGKTLDVSVVNVSAAAENAIPKIQIRSAVGSDELGGEIWENRLFDLILQACCDETGILPENMDAETLQILRKKADVVKEKLINSERVQPRVDINGIKARIAIQREAFEDATRDLVGSTQCFVDQAIADAGNVPIDLVLLTGGAAQMPMISQQMEKRFPGKVELFKPECAVAMGAAIYGQTLVEPPLPPPPPPQKSSPYSSNLIANMIRFAIDHSHDDIAQELIDEVDWKKLTPKDLFEFFNRIRNLFRE